jgi:hypothetical protein
MAAPDRHAHRIALPAALVAACALAVPALTAAESGGVGPDGPCRTAACKTRIGVGGEFTKWRSVELFYPHNERVVVRLRTSERRLGLRAVWGPDGCRRLFRTRGVRARVKTCGEETPVRLLATSTAGVWVKLLVSYRGAPILDGPPPG